MISRDLLGVPRHEAWRGRRNSSRRIRITAPAQNSALSQPRPRSATARPATSKTLAIQIPSTRMPSPFLAHASPDGKTAGLPADCTRLWRETLALQPPADDPVRSQPDELRLEVGEARIDGFPARLVKLRVAADLHGVRSPGNGIVDQEGDLGIGLHVAPLLGVRKIDATKIDGVLLDVEAVRQRHQMGTTVPADGGQPAQGLGLEVGDLGVPEHTHTLQLCSGRAEMSRVPVRLRRL